MNLFFRRRRLLMMMAQYGLVCVLVEDRRIAKHTTTTEMLAHAPTVLFTYFAEYRVPDDKVTSFEPIYMTS